MSPTFIIIAILVWWAAYTLYRLQIRPLALFALKSNLKMTLHSLEMKGVENREISADPAYAIMIKRCTALGECFESINFANVITLPNDPISQAEAKQEGELINQSHHEIRSVERKMFMYVAGAFTINAPFATLVVAALLAMVAWTSYCHRFLHRIFTTIWTLPENTSKMATC